MRNQTKTKPIARFENSISARYRPFFLGDAATMEIIHLIAKDKNVSAHLLMHPSRCRRSAAKARQLAMYLVHVMLGRSLTEVGQMFGRDRTTVSHACGLIEDMRENPRFDADVSRLELAIESRAQMLTGQVSHGAR